MIFQSDDRGVSEVVGVVLIFGFLILALSTFQTVVVPQENAEVEFNSYQAAQGDMVDLRNDLIASGTRGIKTGTAVQTGVTYSERIFTLNPPTPRGSLSTGPTGTVTVGNASAVSTEAANTRAFWDGTARSYNTTGITFRPQYNEFAGQQIVTTGETVYAVGDGQIAPLTGQSLISGDQIRLITIEGDLDESGVRSSLTTVPRSVSTRTVVVTGAGGNPVTLRLDPPPQTTADEWISAYGDETRSANQAVQGPIENESGQVVIELNGSRTYQLKLARVTVGDGGSDEVDGEPAYLIAQQGEASTVPSGKRTTIAAEARDEFNNPVGGVDVTYEVTSGSATLLDESGTGLGNTTTRTTNDDGRAPQSIRITEIESDVTVQATIEGTSGSLTTTSFTIQTPNENNPVELAGVSFEGVTRTTGGQPKDVTIAFDNQNPDTDRTIQRFRMDFYQGSDSPTDGFIDGTSFTVGGNAVSTSIGLPADQTTAISIEFDGNGRVSGGDWFIITVQYDTGDTAQYFASI